MVKREEGECERQPNTKTRAAVIAGGLAMRSVTDFRAKAAAFEALAPTAGSEMLRLAYVELAREYRILADQRERMLCGDPPLPVSLPKANAAGQS